MSYKEARKLKEVKDSKAQQEIDDIVPFTLNQPFMQTDNTRQIFFEQWKNELND